MPRFPLDMTARMEHHSLKQAIAGLSVGEMEKLAASADADVSLVLTGTGDVLEPEDGLIGIGSGGSFALAAARALADRDDMDAEAIARKAMEIAADICIYTNDNIIIESI